MIQSMRGSRIVQSYPGSGTADTIYVTEDGGHWLHNPVIQLVPRFDKTAPSRRIGTIVGNIIVEGRPCR